MKPVGYGLAALVAGIVLLVLSQKVKPAPGAPATASAPASAPATAPGSKSPAPAPKREETVTQSMSGLLLLFSMASFFICLICIGWIVINIRNARPAWKKQTKYPKRR